MVTWNGCGPPSGRSAKSAVLWPSKGFVKSSFSATAPGAKIVFSGSDGKPQTLYYFRTDISDDGLKKSGFLKFAGSLGKGDSFIASFTSSGVHRWSKSIGANTDADRARAVAVDPNNTKAKGGLDAALSRQIPASRPG